MAYQKIKTTKRNVKAKVLAESFGCSTRTIYRAWSQSRADYLAENTISRDKPWKALNIARATWYMHGKPSTLEDLEKSRKKKRNKILKAKKLARQNNKN